MADTAAPRRRDTPDVLGGSSTQREDHPARHGAPHPPYAGTTEDSEFDFQDEGISLLPGPRIHERQPRSSTMDDSKPSTLLTSNVPAHLQQYLTALTATMGALSMGAILGYSSPASLQLGVTNVTNSSCSFPGGDALSELQLSWFSSIVNIGALLGVGLGSIGINKIGRRGTMLSSLVPFLLGWVLIGMASNFAMLVAGRVFCGVCCGLVSLSVPTYLGEISSPDIRGSLSTGFQVMVVSGILYVYGLGAALCWQWLALVCLMPSIVFIAGMFFRKESPTFLLLKDRQVEARDALEHFRGKHYNLEHEMNLLQQSVNDAKNNRGSLKDLMQPHVLKPLMISVTVMAFQQLCGINAILFNLSSIFKEAHSSLTPDVASIIIAVVQVATTLVAAVLMDRAGRKVLLMVSSAAMAVALVGMGVYFYMDEQHHDVTSLAWLPLVSLIVFIAFFSIGYGPIPWVIMAELFTADVREMASSLTTLTNWSLAFLVTLLFQPLQSAINNSGVYWLFAGICVVNFFFCLVVVKETKGKTIEEITAMFGGPPAGNRERPPPVEGYTNHV